MTDYNGLMISFKVRQKEIPCNVQLPGARLPLEYKFKACAVVHMHADHLALSWYYNHDSKFTLHACRGTDGPAYMVIDARIRMYVNHCD